ncbi:ABC transporter substrate-binding protein [Pusillimonas sp. CC-YST705]|uniref:ABC transporter substrate-binding protein n=1 Tax=Mesopusillimonas faecipullorum TaxID=2755040 RepID=A0ABS8CB50_9BURK|nr:ABC transporter substrate-binding protein [Mesopusillimonas faecipullorum]MCB5363079.1 ABC transporter substrate-binding protein [Mesopusillimonas faecipullorum]
MNIKTKLLVSVIAGAMGGLFSGAALADINVGISLSATGPAAALGIPQRNTIPLLPTEIAGQKVNYIILDDATDSTAAGRNARKMVDESKVDILIGSSATPTGAAIAEIANESQTPQITLAPVELQGEKNVWVFRSPQHYDVMAEGLINHMKANNVKSLGLIGYADAYGESWVNAMRKAAEKAGIEFKNIERFNRNDTSVTAQAIKLVSANPDAILVAASGTPSVLPQVTLQDRGYKGRIYQTHGTATKEFIRVGGKAVEGTVMPVGPVMVANQLPETHPSKAPALEYIKLYEDKYGPGSLSPFGAHLYDAVILVESAVPEALKAGQPGTPEFRKGLRDALEASQGVAVTHGVFNMTPENHFGLDDHRSRVMISIEDGDWKLIDENAAYTPKR